MPLQGSQSIGSAMSRALRESLIRRETEKRQQLLDGLLIEDRNRRISKEENEARRQAEQDRIAAEDRTRQRSEQANTAGMRHMVADAALMPGFAETRDAQRQMAAALYREGQPIPAHLQASLQPEPVKEPKTYRVTVPGPDGRPVERVVTEDELKVGVTSYREPPQPREPNFKWVLRGDTVMHLPENQIRPGDVPYQPSGSGDGTEGQRRTGGLLARAQSARATTDALESTIGNWDLLAPSNWMQSENGQRFRQAASQWIQSVLREESGAAIGEGEEASYFRTYFRQPGDSSAVVAQKQRARDAAESAMAAKVGGGASGNTGRGSGAGRVRRYNPATGQLE